MGFSDDIKRFTVKCAANSDAVTRTTVLGITSSIDEMSPVGNADNWAHPEKKPPGYVGGHFRANWQLGVNVQPTGIIEGTAYQGKVEQEQAKIPAKAAGHVYWYQNNLPYAIPLEDGHSGQAPNGMVGLTAVRFGGIVDTAAQAVNK